MAINVFKNVTKNLTTTDLVIYTTPVGYNSIVLMAQISNTSTVTIPTTVKVAIPSVGETSLVTDFEIPGNDAAGVLTGKLVLEAGQSLVASAGLNSGLQMVLSILESQS